MVKFFGVGVAIGNGEDDTLVPLERQHNSQTRVAAHQTSGQLKRLADLGVASRGAGHWIRILVDRTVGVGLPYHRLVWPERPQGLPLRRGEVPDAVGAGLIQKPLDRLSFVPRVPLFSSRFAAKHGTPESDTVRGQGQQIVQSQLTLDDSLP